MTTRPSFSGPKHHCVSGYYKIDLQRVTIDSEYKEPVLLAQEARFVNIQNSIDVSGFLRNYPYYMVPFSSETRNGIHKETLEEWVRILDRSPNQLEDYIALTKHLEEAFNYCEYENGVYSICRDCADKKKCYLAKRIDKKGKVCDQLPKDVAFRINRHYKNNSSPNFRKKYGL
jgi:hypothetical protein